MSPTKHLALASASCLLVVLAFAAAANAEQTKKRFGSSFHSPDDDSIFGNGFNDKTGQDWSAYKKRMLVGKAKRAFEQDFYGFGAPLEGTRFQDWRSYFARPSRFDGGSRGSSFGNDPFQDVGMQNWYSTLRRRSQAMKRANI